jgi:hypothetical protein
MIGLLFLVLVTPFARDFFALDLPRAVVLLAALGIVGITGAIMVLALRALGWARLVPELLKEHPPNEPGALRLLKQRVIESSGWHRSFPTTTEMHHPLARERGDQSVEGESE